MPRRYARRTTRRSSRRGGSVLPLVLMLVIALVLLYLFSSGMVNVADLNLNIPVTGPQFNVPTVELPLITEGTPDVNINGTPVRVGE